MINYLKFRVLQSTLNVSVSHMLHLIIQDTGLEQQIKNSNCTNQLGESSIFIAAQLNK